MIEIQAFRGINTRLRARLQHMIVYDGPVRLLFVANKTPKKNLSKTLHLQPECTELGTYAVHEALQYFLDKGYRMYKPSAPVYSD